MDTLQLLAFCKLELPCLIALEKHTLFQKKGQSRIPNSTIPNSTNSKPSIQQQHQWITHQWITQRHVYWGSCEKQNQRQFCGQTLSSICQSKCHWASLETSQVITFERPGDICLLSLNVIMVFWRYFLSWAQVISHKAAVYVVLRVL